MNLQQIFAERLSALLEEKGISQGDFADAIGCSRQSINFYILGKRSPDISIAALMAKELGVSCDYLIGFSDFRADKQASMTVNAAGLSEDAAKFFAGIRQMADGAMTQEDADNAKELGIDFDSEMVKHQKEHGEETLHLLNALISNDRFGVLLQYIKRYRDLCHGTDELAILKDFMMKLESPQTGAVYGSKEENEEMMKEFCLHVASKYFEEIVEEISKY